MEEIDFVVLFLDVVGFFDGLRPGLILELLHRLARRELELAVDRVDDSVFAFGDKNFLERAGAEQRPEARHVLDKHGAGAVGPEIEIFAVLLGGKSRLRRIESVQHAVGGIFQPGRHFRIPVEIVVLGLELEPFGGGVRHHPDEACGHEFVGHLGGIVEHFGVRLGARRSLFDEMFAARVDDLPHLRIVAVERRALGFEFFTTFDQGFGGLIGHRAGSPIRSGR